MEDTGPGPLVCSAKSCRETAVWALRWNNPKLHTPDREKPYLFLGRLHKAVGRADDAEKMFVRAVQIDPQCLEALRELRLIQMRREKSKGLIGRLFGR